MINIVIPGSVTPLPAAPNPQTDTPVEFDAKANAMVAAQINMVSEINVIAAQTHNNAAAAFEQTQAASNAAKTSIEYASEAQGASNNAEIYADEAKIARNNAALYASEAKGARDDAATNAASVNPDNLKNRANHTGTQPISTISGIGTAASMNAVGAGGIIERGSNANGEYVRFADGTQICTRTVTGYSDGVINIPFAAVFISSPSATVNIAPVSEWAVFSGLYCGNGAWVINMPNYSYVNTLHLFAIGRWK